MDKAVQKERKKLLEMFAASNTSINVKKIDDAIKLAIEAHKGQTRASGEPYVLHPMAVAEILVELKLDTYSIITALLHDTVEDTHITFADIEKQFGTEVAKLVDGVTKLAKIEYQPEHIKQAENFRKLLLAISEDIRVLLVKLADRVHNMRTLNYVENKEKRKRIAHETMEIYAPLAERIGIHKFKNELQDLAFAELHPDIRASILNRLSFLKTEGVPLVETIVNEISEILEKEGIQSAVSGREKTSCSIWRKMEQKNITFEQLSDIIAFRVIVDDISTCYRVLGIMHAAYHVIPGTFRDYISTPKANGYQSLHTVLLGPSRRCIEIQIRTHEMHEIAELGLAAHWAYKQEQNQVVGTQFRWVRELLEILENAASPEEFMENTKLEMYYDQVFCFTPKGDLIALPKGSTPIDFAFAVHSNMGLTCIGAKINGRIVPLKTEIENGDQVEILRAKTPMPSPAWERFVVTGKARAEIRKFIRMQQREEYITLGRAILVKTFEQVDKKFEDNLLTPKIIEHFKRKTAEDLLVAVGEGVVNRSEVLKLLHPEEPSLKKSLNPLSFLRLRPKKQEYIKPSQSMPIKGLIPGMAMHLAGCCHPLPGDRIVGILGTGKGVTVHTSDCESLAEFAGTPEKWIEVSWGGKRDEKYVGRLKVTLSNEMGSLAAVTTCIALKNANISNLKIVGRSLDFFELVIDVEVESTQQLGDLITALRAIESVHSVERGG